MWRAAVLARGQSSKVRYSIWWERFSLRMVQNKCQRSSKRTMDGSLTEMNSVPRRNCDNPSRALRFVSAQHCPHCFATLRILGRLGAGLDQGLDRGGVVAGAAIP